jgi:adenine-specific DNA-methyltransferase
MGIPGTFMAKKKGSKAKLARADGADARSYEHTEAAAALRPAVGVQKQFRGKKPPKQYRYDSSLGPSLEWDEQPARVQGEAVGWRG